MSPEAVHVADNYHRPSDIDKWIAERTPKFPKSAAEGHEEKSNVSGSVKLPRDAKNVDVDDGQASNCQHPGPDQASSVTKSDDSPAVASKEQEGADRTQVPKQKPRGGGWGKGRSLTGSNKS